MIAVRESEYDLVAVVRAAMGSGTTQVGPLLRLARPQLPAMTPSGLLAVRRTLATGLVRALAHGGGARARGSGAGLAGRLWDLRGPPDLVVTGRSVELFRWVLEEALAVPGRRACPLAPADAIGDQALVFLLARLLVRNGLGDVLGERIFRQNALVQLAFADALALATVAEGAERERPAADLGLAPAALLARGDVLVHGFSSWIRDGILDADKPPGALPEAVAVSTFRRRVYATWLTACQTTGRWDLAVPLVDAAVVALSRPEPPALSDPTAPLRDRAAAARAGIVLPEIGLVLAAHMDALGTLEFFDDGYAEAQRLRNRWAPLERVRPVAEGRIRQVAGV